MSSKIIGGHDFVDPRQEFGFGHAACSLRNDGPVAVHEEGRNAAHTELSGRSGVLFRIHLGDEKFSLFGHGFQHRSNGFARGAPWSPEINDNPLGSVDGLVEFAIADVPYFAHMFTESTVEKGHYRRLRLF